MVYGVKGDFINFELSPKYIYSRILFLVQMITEVDLQLAVIISETSI